MGAIGQNVLGIIIVLLVIGIIVYRKSPGFKNFVDTKVLSKVKSTFTKKTDSNAP